MPIVSFRRFLLPLVVVACQPTVQAGTPSSEGSTGSAAHRALTTPAEAVTTSAATAEGTTPRPDVDELGAASSATQTRAEEYAAIVTASDRSEEDRALDPGRKPAELLAFSGIESGMKVAELAAGGGYTAELLARAVGPSGVVYGQNSPFILERFAEAPWSARLKKPVMSSVVRVDREFDSPFPPETPALDVVMMVLFYHDTVWFGTDRAAMNRAIYDALKPGGLFVIVDHSARPGDGIAVAETLHRIEEAVVLKELEAAGFVIDASADFLRNPQDTKDWNASPRSAGEQRGTSDRFVVRVRKPAT